MLKSLRHSVLVIAVLMLGATLLINPEVSAAPEDDMHSAIYDTVYYDLNEYGFDTCGEGGGAATGTGTGGATAKVPVTFSLGSGATQRQANLVKALKEDYGLSPAQAAGIVGNFMHESSGTAATAVLLPPDVNQGSTTGAPPKFSGGYGWAQWTGSRQRTFINYAVQNGYMASSSVRATDAANYAYLKHELNTGYTNTITKLRALRPLQDEPEAGVAARAAVSFEATFERAGVPALEPRKANARTALAAYNEALGTIPGTTPPPSTPGAPATGGCPDTSAPGGGVGIVGNYAFPLSGTKKVVKNPGMFRNGTADKGGHPYTAYDILANTGTPVVAFLSGEVTHIGTDRCPGRLISVYNKESNLTISYLHLNTSSSTHVAKIKNKIIPVGSRVGLVGSAGNGCGIPHLHIDAAQGNDRPGCSRKNCPSSNAAKFVNIGPQLYQTFQKLPN